MRFEPDIKTEEQKKQSFSGVKKTVALIIAFISVFAFFFKILFF